METLKMTWISKSSVIQRKGRAGRIADGECFHLYPFEFSVQLDQHITPEIERCALEKVLLQLLFMEESQSLLRFSVQIPNEGNVRQSEKNLITTGCAILKNNKLEITNLGFFVIRLPTDIKVAKFIFFGLYFGFFSTSCTVAALLGMRESLRKEAVDAFNRKMKANTFHSDILMLLNAEESVKNWEVQEISKDYQKRIFSFDKKGLSDYNYLKC